MNRAGVVVLTGGKSSRMGRDKASLNLSAGLTFSQIICSRVPDVSEKFLSVSSYSRSEYPGFKVVTDRYPGTGPMGAVLSVMECFGGTHLLVLACDMPDFSKDEAERLLGLYHGEDALIPSVMGRWQPLSAVYSVNMAPRFAEALAMGNYRMRDAVAGSDYRILEIDEGRAGNYININTPEELENYAGGR
jgi:molybdopterin-guanine dinucleotide biosynthesis protein A